MKRFFAGMTAALLAVILAFSFPVDAISARCAVLMDCATGRVLFQKQADERSLIASTTKIMTALVVCEQCNVLDRVKISKESVGIEGSSMYLQEGEILTVQELLYGMMLHSGNDAATALAIYCGGTLEVFAQMMNDKARSLGLSETHFENPHGLDGAAHYSTARDLGVLAAYAMQNPVFEQIVSTKTTRIGNRYLRNHNKLLWQIDGADGVKTGYTKAAGRILVSSARRDGRRLVAVTISDPDDWNDHKTLIEQGFDYFHVRDIIRTGDILGAVEIAGGQAKTVELVAQEDFSYSFMENEMPEIRLPEPGFVYAPVVSGQYAGNTCVYLDNQCIGKIPMIYGETVEQEVPTQPGLWKRLFGGIRS